MPSSRKSEVEQKNGDLQSKQFLAPKPTEFAKKNLPCKLDEDSNSYWNSIMNKICIYIYVAL